MLLPTVDTYEREMATVIVAAYLMFMIGLPIGVAFVMRFRSLPTGPLCPHCLSETLWIQGSLLSRVPLPRRPLIQRRWCPACGWDGLARPGVRRTSPRTGPTPTTVDLRAVELNGAAFRVLLRCRAESQAWHGRLVFITEEGEARPEGVEAFHGRTVSEVLAQALALSEHSLAYRLRQALSG